MSEANSESRKLLEPRVGMLVLHYKDCNRANRGEAAIVTALGMHGRVSLHVFGKGNVMPTVVMAAAYMEDLTNIDGMDQKTKLPIKKEMSQNQKQNAGGWDFTEETKLIASLWEQVIKLESSYETIRRILQSKNTQ